MLSVIIPVYNVEQYIKRCIESVISQSFTDLEIILVDDGSTDKSGDICDAYASKDSRIKVIHKKNGGLSSARNKGIEKASGEYLTFLDSDDYVHHDMYKVLLDAQKDYDADIVGCEFQLIDNNTIPENVDIESLKMSCITGNDIYNQLWEKDSDTVVQCTKIFKRSIFYKIRFPEGKIHEDVFVIHHELSMCNRYIFIEAPLYYYEQHEGSIMHSESFESVSDAIDGYENRIDFFVEKKMYPYAKKTMDTLFQYICWRYSLASDSIDKKRIQKKAINILEHYKRLLNMPFIYGVKIRNIKIYLLTKNITNMLWLIKNRFYNR